MEPHNPTATPTMVITEPLARRFIGTYTDFLGSLLPDSAKAGKRTTQWLVTARKRFLGNQSRLQAYVRAHPQADAAMLEAIAALRIRSWIYLKDTTAYSVWMDEAGERAYGVLGLTQRVRDLCQGGSGVILTAGLMPLGGRWVTDGLVENLAWLGPNYRRDLKQAYNRLRQSGRFSTGPA